MRLIIPILAILITTLSCFNSKLTPHEKHTMKNDSRTQSDSIENETKDALLPPNQIIPSETVPNSTKPDPSTKSDPSAEPDTGPRGFLFGQPGYGTTEPWYRIWEPDISLDSSALVITDMWSGRALVWSQKPTNSFTAPDYVVGKLDPFDKEQPECTDESLIKMKHAGRVSSNDTHIAVIDTNCRNILIWPKDIQQHGESAIARLQPACTGASSDITMTNDMLITSCNGGNGLISIWSPIPESSVAPNLTLSGNGAINFSDWKVQRSVSVAGGKLFVAIRDNKGLLVWNSIPSSDVAPDVILGAPAFNTVGTGTDTEKDICTSITSIDANSNYVVAMEKNCDGKTRLLVWNNSSLTDYKPADFILRGYRDIEDHSLNILAPTFIDLAKDSNMFAMGGADGFIRIWHSLPDSATVKPDIVLDGFSRPTSDTLSYVQDILLIEEEDTILVMSSDQNRILSFPSDFYTGNTAAKARDFVIGQSSLTNFQKNRGGLNAITENTLHLRFSGAMDYGSGILAISDHENKRVLLYNGVPKSNSEKPFLVLGQPTFNALLATGVDETTLGKPGGIAIADDKIFLLDPNRHRLLIWNSVPESNAIANKSATQGPPANIVIGQPDFTSNAANHAPLSPGTVSEFGFQNPGDVIIVGNKMVVSDSTNHRVLIWNSIPTSNHTPADIVLGQADFTSNLPNRGNPKPSAGSLNFPEGIASNGTDLWVADRDNQRVLRWHKVPTASDTPADAVYGQKDLVSAVSYPNPENRFEFQQPRHIAISGNKVLVSLYGQSRVIGFKLGEK